MDGAPGHNLSCLRAAVAACALVLAAGAAAQILGDADPKAAANALGGFPGAGGKGWTSPWLPSACPPGKVSGRVLQERPLADAAAYYQLSFTGSTGDQCVSRRYGALGKVDLHALHRISLVWRLDSDPAAFKGPGDYVTISDGVDPAVRCSSGDSTFILRAFAGNVKDGPPGGFWLVYQGGQDGGAYEMPRFVKTDLPFRPGVAYRIQIFIDPVNRTWWTVLQDDKTTYSSVGLGFRTSKAVAPGLLKFNARIDQPGDTAIVSVANLRVDCP